MFISEQGSGARWPGREVGRIGSTRIVIPGENDATPLWRLRSGLYVRSRETSDLLRSELRQYDASYFTSMCAALSARRLMDHEAVTAEIAKVSNPNLLFRQFQLALLLQMMFTDPERTDWTGARVTLEEMADLCLMLGYIRCSSDAESRSQSDIGALAFRHFFQQFWENRDLTAWPRGLLIFSRSRERLASGEIQFDLDRQFEAVTGVAFDHFQFISFGLFAAATQQPGRVFDASHFANFDIPEAAITSALALISRDFNNLRAQHVEWIRAGINVPGYEPYHLNPLFRWPVVSLPSGQLTAPVPRLLLDRISSGVYFDFMEALPEVERSRFGVLWGLGFQDFVGSLMRSQNGFEQLGEECQFEFDGTNYTPCDWMVRDADVAILIECKTRGLGPKVRVTGKGSDIEASVARLDSRHPESSLAGGLAKLFKMRDMVLAGAPGLELLHGVSRVISLLVTLDPIPEGNQPYIRDILAKKASEFGSEPDDSWQLVDIDGFERFCALIHASGSSPADLLTRKLESRESTLHDFLGYFGQQAPNLRVMDHPLYKDGQDPFEELVRRFAPQSSE